jgi:hypothetical protein
VRIEPAGSVRYAEDHSADLAIAFAEADRPLAIDLASSFKSHGLRVLTITVDGQETLARLSRDGLLDPSGVDAVFAMLLLSSRLATEMSMSFAETLALASQWTDYVLPVLADDSATPSETGTVIVSLEEFGASGIADLCRRRLGTSQAHAPVMLNVESLTSCDMDRFDRTLAPYLSAHPEFIRVSLPLRIRLPAELSEYAQQLRRAVDQGRWTTPVSSETLARAAKLVESIDTEVVPHIAGAIRTLLYGALNLELSLTDAKRAVSIYVLAEVVGLGRHLAMYLFCPQPPAWVRGLRQAGIPASQPAPVGLPWVLRELGWPITLWVDADLFEARDPGRKVRVYVPDGVLLENDARKVGKRCMFELIAPQLIVRYRHDPAGDLHIQYALAYHDRFEYIVRGEWVYDDLGAGPFPTQGFGSRNLYPLRQRIERRVDERVREMLPDATDAQQAFEKRVLMRNFDFLPEEGA